MHAGLHAFRDDDEPARLQRGLRLTEDEGEIGRDVEAVHGVDRVERAGRDALRAPRPRHVELRGFHARSRGCRGARRTFTPARERGDELREAPERDARAEAPERRFGSAPAAAADLEDLDALRRAERARASRRRACC